MILGDFEGVEEEARLGGPPLVKGKAIHQMAILRAARATNRYRRAGALAFELLRTALLTVAVVIAVRSVVEPFRVEGASMDPTLDSGQHVLINKVQYATVHTALAGRFAADPAAGRGATFLFGGPRRGEVVVFRVPGRADWVFIKRVVGLPGDTIRIVGGQVLVNNEPLDEPYVRHHDADDLPATTVPAGAYFLMGDNRPESSDSRVFGPVPAGNIIGRA